MHQVTSAAFMSYAHDDDHDGAISELRVGLEREVGQQTGLRGFRIFQDRSHIEWGSREETIDAAVDAAVLLIPVVTPYFLNSEQYRRELHRFLDRERRLARGNLILPIYYIEDRRLEDPGFRRVDDLVGALAARQYTDLREDRHRPLAGGLSMPAAQNREASEQAIKAALESCRAKLAAVELEIARLCVLLGVPGTKAEP